MTTEISVSRGTPVWRGIGTAATSGRTSAEVIDASGLNWAVATEPAYTVNGGETALIPGYRAVVRNTDRRTLGIVRERFVPVQNADAFASMDRVIENAKATYQAAGSIDGGRGIWILAKLPGQIRVAKDDVSEKFLLLTNTHDGTAALRVVWTPIRVACENVLRLALSQAFGEALSIRHTASALNKLSEAEDAFGRAGRYFEAFDQTAKQLAATAFNDAQMALLASTLLPTEAEKPSKRVMAMRERLVELFEYGLGHSQIRGTAWAALNAVAELTDQHRSFADRGDTPGPERRFTNALYGSGHELKQRAYELIVAQAAGAGIESLSSNA